jgi:cytochrome b561
MSAPDRYSSLQKTLHWTIALIVAVMIPLGFYMLWRYGATDFDAVTVQLFDAHKLLGFILLSLVVVRASVRLLRGVPPLPATISPFQRIAANVTHRSIYLLLFIVPLLGWVGASAYDLRSLPGGLALPEILPVDKDLGGRIMWWHGWAAIVLGLLVALHIGAALLHLVVLRDGVFQRMWPSGRDRTR